MKSFLCLDQRRSKKRSQETPEGSSAEGERDARRAASPDTGRKRKAHILTCFCTSPPISLLIFKYSATGLASSESKACTYGTAPGEADTQ